MKTATDIREHLIVRQGTPEYTIPTAIKFIKEIFTLIIIKKPVCYTRDYTRDQSHFRWLLSQKRILGQKTRINLSFHTCTLLVYMYKYISHRNIQILNMYATNKKWHISQQLSFFSSKKKTKQNRKTKNISQDIYIMNLAFCTQNYLI